MTEQQTAELLAVIAAAYPDQFKEMKRKRAEAILALWSNQLASMDAGIVSIALDRHIKSSPFVPKISDIREQIRQIYYEAKERIFAMRFVGLNEDVLKEVQALMQKIEETGVVRGGYGVLPATSAGNYKLSTENGA